MKAIFDESVPRDLLPLLRECGCDVAAFPNSWKGTKNGQLMALVEDAAFDCLITSDKNLPFQQNIAKRKFAVVVLTSPRFEELKDLIEHIAMAVSASKAGEVRIVAK